MFDQNDAIRLVAARRVDQTQNPTKEILIIFDEIDQRRQKARF